MIKRTEKKRVVEITRRMTHGLLSKAEQLLRASRGGSVLNTAFIERLNGTFRQRLACLTRKCRHASRRLQALERGMYLIGCTYNFCVVHHELSKTSHLGSACTPVMAAGLSDHIWSVCELLSYRIALIAGLAQPQFHGADLVFGRIVQGVGGALLVTNSTAIVTDAFRKGQVGFGLGINQIAGAAGFLIGPIVGGLLTEASWRWVFLFNVPIAVLGAIWGAWRLRESVKFAAHQHIDWFGAITLTVGLAGTLLALSLLAFPLFGQTVTYTILVIGLIGLVAFGAIEPRIKEPLIDLRLFRDRLFLLANLSGLLNGIARGAVLFLLIFFLQGPYGQDPLRAGLLLIPFGAAFMLIGPISGRLSDHIGSRVLAPVGLGISAVGLLGLSTVSPSTPYWLLALYMALMGGGSGLFVSPNTNAIMSSVLPQRRGAAAGILSMLNNTGQMLSIAIVFPLALSSVPIAAMMQVFIYGGGMSQFPSALALFLHGLHSAFLVSFALSLVAMIVAALRPSH